MSYPPHDPHSPGGASHPGQQPGPWDQQPGYPLQRPRNPQQPDYQQPEYQQQPLGYHQPAYQDQGWGSQHAQAWAPTVAPKKSTTGAIAILVALAVLVASVGVWALTTVGRNKAEPAVEAFFELLNTQKPSYSQFTKHVTGIDFRNVYDATRNSPGGTWSLVSVGEVADDKVPVTYKHNDKEFTADFEVRQDGNKTKLFKPFSYVTFTADERLRFVLGTSDELAVLLDRQAAFFPGSYTITPLPGYSGDKPTWEPIEPNLDLLPGTIKAIALQPKLTTEAASTSQKAVTDAFNECLKSDSFYPPGCPFRTQRPADADFPTGLVWSITPADAPTKPVLDEASGVTNPCYQIKGTMKYSYTTRSGGTSESRMTEITSTGCVRLSLGSMRVTWSR